MLKKSLPFVCLFIGLVVTPSLLQAQAVRKYSNEFLNIGVSARAFGMSNATVASVSDVTAGYWNPAGLLGLKSDFQVAAMHAEYFAGIAKFDYGAFATKTKNGDAFGVSIIRFGVDDIPNTTELIDNEGRIDYNRITTFSAADYAFLISYARKLKIEGLHLGGNAKIIYRQVGDFARATGFGLDAALQYQRNGWQLGAIVRDVTTTFNNWSYSLSDRTKQVFTQTGNEIPQNALELTLPRLIIGGGRRFELGKQFGIYAETNLDMPFDGERNTLVSTKVISFDPTFGFEADFKQLVFLRGGLGNFQKVKAEIGNYTTTTFQPNFGIGLQLKGFAIDYALTDIGDQSAALYSNVFSLRIDFFKSKK